MRSRKTILHLFGAMGGGARGFKRARVPRLQWKTWVRLAFVEAGSDWRSLNRLAVENGHLREYLIVPNDPAAWHPNVLGVNRWNEPATTVTSESRPTTGRFFVADPRAHSSYEGGGFMGVRRWDQASGTVQGESRPSNGAFSVADPRFAQSADWNDGHAYGVRQWDETSSTVTAKLAPGGGYGSVADPRTGTKHNNCFRIVPWGEASGTVTAGTGPSAGGQAVADPRGPQGRLFGKYHCADWADTSRTVISGDNNGAYAVADPRAGMDPERSAAAAGQGGSGGKAQAVHL